MQGRPVYIRLKVVRPFSGPCASRCYVHRAALYSSWRSNCTYYSASGWNMFYFLWGVFRVRGKDYSSLPPDVSKHTGQSNLNKGPWALGPNASVQSCSQSFSNDINNFAKSETNFVKNTACADNEQLSSLEANHQECLNGANSLNQPVSGAALDKSHDSVTASCSTNSNGGIGNFAATTEKNHQKLNYSGHQDILCGSINGNVSERDFDVNLVPDDCSMPLIPDEGGVCKRDLDMVSGAHEVDGALEHKKIKLDNVLSASSGLCEIIDDVRLSSMLHHLSGPSVDNGTCNKPMASTNGKCVLPLDLNAVDAVSGDIVNILSSDEDFARAGSFIKK